MKEARVVEAQAAELAHSETQEEAQAALRLHLTQEAAGATAQQCLAEHRAAQEQALHVSKVL